MNPILFWLGALLVVSVLSPVLKVLIAAVAGKQIGASALAKQPESIHLERRNGSAWKDGAAARRYSAELIGRGFEDAGVYAVREMPGMLVQLLAHSGDSFTAAIYEHPQAGHWLDLCTRFQDGSSYTLATSKPTGLAPRPDHPVTHAPGLGASAALDRALTERPRKWFEAATADGAVAMFEKAYAESIAYRRQVGISRGEVMKVATRKAA